jgi:hypothetical protein
MELLCSTAVVREPVPMAAGTVPADEPFETAPGNLFQPVFQQPHTKQEHAESGQGQQ